MGTYQQRDVYNIKRDMQHMLRVYWHNELYVYNRESDVHNI